MIYLLVTIIVLYISYHFFYLASGSMSIRELNLGSYFFYYKFIIYAVIGSVIIVNNMDYSAWFRYIHLTQEVRIYGWIAILYTVLMFPIGMILATKVLHVNNMSVFFKNYREKSLVPYLSKKDSYIFFSLFFLSMISILSITYTFIVIGKVPLLEVFKATGAWDLARLRMEAKMGFDGNTYIRQIFAIMLTPLLSYIYFLYYKLYKKKVFLLLFIVYFFLSFLILTYNFEKAPFLNYLFGFLFFSVFLNGKISKKFLYGTLFFILFLVIGMYIFIMDKELWQLIDLQEAGILQRVLIAQVVGVFTSFQLFPDVEPFVGLQGLKIYSAVIGAEQSEGVSRLMMIHANPEGIKAGIAGFMVSLFISEAWGNFGILGLLIAPIYVGFVVQFLYIFLLKKEKTPIILALTVFLILYWPVTSLLGKFYYNPALIIFISLIYIVYVVGNFLKRNYYKKNSNNNSHI